MGARRVSRDDEREAASDQHERQGVTFLGLSPSDRPALIEPTLGTSISFTELLEHGREVAALLGESRQLMFVFSRNDVFTATAYSGALLGGHAVALVDVGAAASVNAALVNAYLAPWLAGPPGLAEVMRKEAVPIASVVALEGGELVRTGHPSASLHPDLAVMLATSGTTGSRKFVRLSFGNIESNARSIALYLGLSSGERPIASLPFQYSFGLSVLNSHWCAGAAVVLATESFVRPSFWDAVRAAACTSMAGVPYTFQVLEKIGFRDMDLPSLRTLQQAGGALDRRLAQIYDEHMGRRGGRFFVMYGQTEATARIAYVPPGRLAEKPGSAGIAIPGGRIWIDRNDAPPSEPATGEVVYEGPNVMMGYASGSGDLQHGDELHGVLRTGDIGYLDDERFLYLVGRSKRIAKVFGLRINLDELELLIREHGPAAVVAGTDAIWAFCAFGTDESILELADALASRFTLHRGTLRFRRVDSIPASISGKTDYLQVQQWVLEAR